MIHKLDNGHVISLPDGRVIDDPEERYAFFSGLEEHQKNWYKVQREGEYPPIGDQLDALFKAGVFPADMAAAIQAVKDKYPKGTA